MYLIVLLRKFKFWLLKKFLCNRNVFNSAARMFGPSGTPETRDAMCLLPQNIMNEKIFLFLWFWMIFLIALNSFNVSRQHNYLQDSSRPTFSYILFLPSPVQTIGIFLFVEFFSLPFLSLHRTTR